MRKTRGILMQIRVTETPAIRAMGTPATRLHRKATRLRNRRIPPIRIPAIRAVAKPTTRLKVMKTMAIRVITIPVSIRVRLRYVRTVTTPITLTRAHPMDTMGRAGSRAASLSALGRGHTGAGVAAVTMAVASMEGADPTAADSTAGAGITVAADLPHPVTTGVGRPFLATGDFAASRAVADAALVVAASVVATPLTAGARSAVAATPLAKDDPSGAATLVGVTLAAPTSVAAATQAAMAGTGNPAAVPAAEG